MSDRIIGRPFQPGQSGNLKYRDGRGDYPTGFFKRGKWQYQKDRPKCSHCGKMARYHTKNKDGSVKYWRKYCTMCHKNTSHSVVYGYRMHKKDKCEFCNFIPIHSIQLTVDHKDGNHKNNDINNLQTLCFNCHMLKTVMSGDHNGEAYIPENRNKTGNE